MATNFNVSPYYDDYSDDKLFHRILFRPAFAVQARELTQLQTILQNQVARFGQHMFKEGSQIIPGEIQYHNKIEYVKLASFSTTNLSDLKGIELTGASSGVVAQVEETQAATTTTAATLFIAYTKSGTNNASARFTDGETLNGTNSSGTAVSAVVGVTGTVLPTDTDATGRGSAVKVEEGVYFVDGFFVKNLEQTLVLEAYSQLPSYRVGFTVTDSFVTPEDDESLKDNAQGSSNVNAPGAHRLKKTLTLAKISLTSTSDSDFVELMKINQGVVETKVIKTDYNILEDTLARRTFDESGNYVINNPDIDIREHHNDGTTTGQYNRGIYKTDSDGKYESGIFTEAESKARLAVGISPMKAYVFGYEAENMSTIYRTIKKGRDTNEVNNSSTSLQLGNSVDVTNIHGSVDVGTVTGETQAFRELILNKNKTETRGVNRVTVDNNVNQIGRAKPRFFEFKSGTAGSTSTNTSSVYKLGLFDVQMFTHLSGATTVSFVTGETLTGSTSGATGIIESISTSDADLDKISLEAGTDDGTGSIVLDSTDGSANAGENVALESSSFSTIVLSNVKGTFVAGETITDETGNSTTVGSDSPEKKAVNSFDISETKQISQAGSPPFTADTVLTATSVDPNDISNTLLSGTVSISQGGTTLTGSLTRFSTELRVGDQISFADDNGVTRQVLISAIDSNTNAAIGSNFSGSVTNAVASLQRAKLSGVDNSSLVFKLPENTIKTLKTDSNSGLTDSNHKVRRQFVETLSSEGTATFTAGANETFTAHAEGDFTLSIMTAGASDGAVGDIVSLAGNNHEGSAKFSLGGSPTGRTLTVDLGANFATAKVKLIGTITRSVADEKSKTLNTGQTQTITTQAQAQDSSISLGKADIFELTSVHMAADFSTTPTTSATDITDRFILDNGQRDSFYDIGRINYKPGAQKATGQLLITFKFFSHGAGDYFSVDSYSGVVDYENIPAFTSPTKGILQLRDCIDFRPRVSDDSKVVGFANNASISSKNYINAGSSTVDIFKPGTTFTSDFEFFLPRIDAVYMSKDSSFVIKPGASSIDPQRPEPLDDALLLYYLRIPAFTFSTADIQVTPVDNKRYTMRDIGALEKRIENVEYYTSLSLLEQTALNTQVQDADGLDRFKNGFLVDTMKGHNVADALSEDYAASMDMDNGTVRPLFFCDQVEMIEENTTDTQRAADGYQKTGDLITLPYTEEVFLENNFAVKSVNVNPFAVSQYVGVLKLTPDVDEWKSLDARPDLVVNNENLFDAVKDIPNPSHALGTTWNEWQTNWTGTFKETTQSGSIRTTKEGRTGTATRSGITRSLSSKVMKQNFGERVIDMSYIPFIRAKDISFSATQLKPNTRVYPFFDEIDISTLVTPTSGSAGGALITDSNGAVSGTFALPDPSVSGNPKWRTGTRNFRLTSSSSNSPFDVDVDTFAQKKYIARGIQLTKENTIHATRVPDVISTTVREQEARRTIDSSTSVDLSPPHKNYNSSGGDNDNHTPGTVVIGSNNKYTGFDRNDPQPNAPGGNSGGSCSVGGTTRVICTWLHSKGLFSLEDYTIDVNYSVDNISLNTKLGYWLWAIDLVNRLEKRYQRNNWYDKLVIGFWKYGTQARANQIKKDIGLTNKGNLLGKFLRVVMEPACYVLGTLLKPYVIRKHGEKLKMWEEQEKELTKWL